MVSDDFNWSGNLVLQSKQLWRITSLEYLRGALSALGKLYDRIRSELDACRVYAIDIHDVEKQTAVKWLTEWLDEEGCSIIHHLRAKIESGASQDHVLMERAIHAAENLAITSGKDELKTADDWDTAFDWTKEVLPALCRSFEEFGVESVCQTTTYTDNLLDESQYTSVLDPISVSSESKEVWRCSSLSKDIQSSSFAA